jgi:surfeit locus 1 family protein
VKKRWFYYLFSACLCLVFVSLGRWQLSRAAWKQQRLEDVAIVLKAKTPQSLSLLTMQTQTGLAWAAGQGHFLETPALLLDNQRRGDQVGVHVYRAFQPDQGRALLVDLGWLVVPGERKMPRLEKMSGNYQLNGLLAPPPSPGFAIGPAYSKINSDYWLLTRMSISELSKELKIPLATRVLRLNPELPIGYARDLDILPNTLPPEKHQAYALQWFGFAIATLVTTLILTLRRKKS